MKSKFTKILSPEKEPDKELEENAEDSSEVEDGGPAIASTKKNRLIVIALSSILITVVIYFNFFKSAPPEKVPEKLQEVVAPPTKNVAKSDDGKSPFEIDIPKEKTKEDVELLDKPAVPEIPSLPEGAVLPQDNIPAPVAEPALPTIAPNQQALPNQQKNDISNPVIQTDKAPDVVEKKKDIDPRYSPIVVFSGGGDSKSLGVGYDKNIINLNENPIGKLDKSKIGVTTTYVGDRVHAITQGKLINAVLETAVNTEIPGSVRGIISRDVYGESGNEVLIPKGSRLYGSYSSQIAKGQGRVNISWTRLIRPDGVDLGISFNASDQFGRSGIPGNVDNKYGSVIAGSLLTSVLTVGAAAAANKILGSSSNVSTTTSNGSTTTTGSAANQAVADVSKTIIDTAGQIVSNSINTTPVITVPQGTKITVIVNSDMNLPSILAGY
ncbi:MAG: TrbI/VirB10 family protein [Proteobacteria bacterium]|nr:TrbI/VirB10 family protein [Pseudomonadota bacterium]